MAAVVWTKYLLVIAAIFTIVFLFSYFTADRDVDACPDGMHPQVKILKTNPRAHSQDAWTVECVSDGR